MGKPTEKELEQAILKAQEMREHGEDPDHVAKALLSLNYRYNEWQKVIKSLKLYMHSGNSTTEHQRLVKALQAAEKMEQEHETDFGLE